MGSTIISSDTVTRISIFIQRAMRLFLGLLKTDITGILTIMIKTELWIQIREMMS
jgi:tetrahydromethanopterin S-methyltransferase subunit F